MLKNLLPFLQPNKLFIKKAFINSLILEYSNFIFISPHIDDAVLSCGNLISELKRLNKNVQIVDIFTKSLGRNITPQSKQFLNQCNYKSSVKLFSDRAKEELAVSRYLNVKATLLNYIDAAWRVSNNRPIYENKERQFSGVISNKDMSISNTIKHKLNKLVTEERTLILSPLGIGDHVDHIITREIVNTFPNQKLYWEDFPYNLDPKARGAFLNKNQQYSFCFKYSKIFNKQKNYVIKLYKSQINSLFPSGRIPNVGEHYYCQGKTKPF